MRDNRSEKLKTTLCIILLSILLKLFHYLFQFAGAENYLLRIIAWITGNITGTAFFEILAAEFISDNGLFQITAACSGWRLFILYFLFGHIHYFFQKPGCSFSFEGFYKRTCFIYLFSFWINILRIVFFIQFHFILISCENYLFSHTLFSMLIAACGYFLLIKALSKERKTQYELGREIIF